MSKFKVLSLKLGTRTNPDTQQEVVSAYGVVEGLEKPVRILDTVEELKAAGKPAEVLTKLLMGEHPQYGSYLYLPKIAYSDLKW